MEIGRGRSGNLPLPVLASSWMLYFLPREMASTAIHHGAAILKLAPLIVAAPTCFYLGREGMSETKGHISLLIEQLHRMFCRRGRNPSASLISLL